jgi:hypothetical protein
MVEDSVVKDQLTDAMIEAGAEITRKLDELGLQPDAALWFFMPEVNEWRLLFSSPEVATKGPREVYGRIQLALEQLGEKASAAPFSAIGLLDPNDDLVKLLRVAARTGPGIRRIRFAKNVINGRFIDDALLYRVA